MNLVVWGISHNTASVALRERLALDEIGLKEQLLSLQSCVAIDEVFILSTCHRTEIYVYTDRPAAAGQFLAQYYVDIMPLLAKSFYMHEGLAAIEHLMRVACGLDSMVVGEPQIFGQLKASVVTATELGCFKKQFGQLLPRVYEIAKKIRHHTALGACPTSLASSAVKLIHKQIANIALKKILIIGAGETCEIIAKHLHGDGLHNVIIMSRRLESAENLANRYSMQAMPLEDLDNVLGAVGVVFTATSNPDYMITPDNLKLNFECKDVLESGGDRDTPSNCMDSSLGLPGSGADFDGDNKLLIDLAMPRDIDPAVAELDNISLYNIDDLREAIAQNIQAKNHAAQKAEVMIKSDAADYMRWAQSLEAVELVRAYRQQIESFKDQSLEKAKQVLHSGAGAEEALEQFSNHLIQKIMHKPSVQMRKAGYDGRKEMLECVSELFEL